MGNQCQIHGQMPQRSNWDVDVPRIKAKETEADVDGQQFLIPIIATCVDNQAIGQDNARSVRARLSSRPQQLTMQFKTRRSHNIRRGDKDHCN